MYNIAVIGGGVIGLTSALAIQKKFATNVKIFTKELSPNTTGDVAAGLWLPYLLQNTSDEQIEKWSRLTRDYLLKLWKEGKAKETGVSLQLIIKVSSDKNYKLPKWINASLGYSKLSPEELEKYGKKFNKKFVGGYALVSFIWEASIFLPFLLEDFIKNGGEIEIRNIENFQQIPNNFDVIVNCTGLNSRILVPDMKVHPIRGQISRVEAPWQFHTFTEDSIYIIPNQNCIILGGTQQINDFNLSIDENDKRGILNGCSSCVPALTSTKIIKDYVGLRPARDQIRLEIENRTDLNGKIRKIVHNYGHGGSGITLSIGCAQTAADLVGEALDTVAVKCNL